MSNYLTPSYLETDFQTLRTRLENLMKNNEVFKDYNYEGSNISLIIELVSYVADLNVFYLNKLAKNIHPDTADIYEVVHSLVRLQGHEPKGYRGAEIDLTVTVSQSPSGTGGSNNYEATGTQQLFVPAGYKLDSGLTTEDGDNIYFTTTKDFTYTIPSSAGDSVSFDLPMRQGFMDKREYKGRDSIENQIFLPFYQYDHGEYPYEEDSPSVRMFVNDTEWTRVPDFYDEITGLSTEDNVYMFKYDKYGRYIIEFSSSRNTPDNADDIEVWLVRTEGANGSIGSGTITESPGEDANGKNFLTNLYTGAVIDKKHYTVNNAQSSTGAGDPQTLDELKESGKLKAQAQYRNVTSDDYIGNLQDRGDVTVANAWGEQEEDPGNTTLYNKVYLSVIPSTWNDNSIVTTTKGLPVSFTGSTSGSVIYPSSYNSDWLDEIKEYLEPRKMLGSWEEFEVPSLVWFRIDIGLQVKRTYSFSNIQNDLKDKLEYYFDATNRKFNEIIDFRDIHNYLLDTSEISPNNDFEYIKGIRSLVIRDVLTYVPTNSSPGVIYAYNTDNLFPHYTREEYGTTVDNILKPIQLGYNQFPMITIDYCTISNEG